jgi:hypothetical protein
VIIEDEGFVTDKAIARGTLLLDPIFQAKNQELWLEVRNKDKYSGSIRLICFFQSNNPGQPAMPNAPPAQNYAAAPGNNYSYEPAGQAPPSYGQPAYPPQQPVYGAGYVQPIAPAPAQYGATQPYGAPQQAPVPYGAPQQAPVPYGAPQPYGSVPISYGAPQQVPLPYGTAQQAPIPYGAPQPYGSVPVPYGAPQPYGSAPIPYGAPQPYGSAPGQYGAPQQYGSPAYPPQQQNVYVPPTQQGLTSQTKTRLPNKINKQRLSREQIDDKNIAIYWTITAQKYNEAAKTISRLINSDASSIFFSSDVSPISLAAAPTSRKDSFSLTIQRTIEPSNTSVRSVICLNGMPLAHS